MVAMPLGIGVHVRTTISIGEVFVDDGRTARREVVLVFAVYDRRHDVGKMAVRNITND